MPRMSEQPEREPAKKPPSSGVSFHRIRGWVGCRGWGFTEYGATVEIAWQRWLKRWHETAILRAWD